MDKLDNEIHVCEHCGKEHNGSFGSGRFCSKSCRSKYSSSKMKHHVCNFNVHGTCIPAKGNWKCVWCGEIFRTRREMQNHKHEKHFEYVPCGPNNKGGRVWNKGLTKETNEIVRQRGQTLSKNLKSGKTKNVWLGRHHSEETKQKISSSCGDIHHNFKHVKTGSYQGIWCDSGWELAWVVYNLEHNIKFKRNKMGFDYYDENKQRTRKYYPDFILDDGTFVEIKGWDNKDWKMKISQFPKDIKLIVLYDNEIKPYLDYVIEKYGKDFTFKLFEK